MVCVFFVVDVRAQAILRLPSAKWAMGAPLGVAAGKGSSSSSSSSAPSFLAQQRRVGAAGAGAAAASSGAGGGAGAAPARQPITLTLLDSLTGDVSLQYHYVAHACPETVRAGVLSLHALLPHFPLPLTLHIPLNLFSPPLPAFLSFF